MSLDAPESDAGCAAPKAPGAGRPVVVHASDAKRGDSCGMLRAD